MTTAGVAAAGEGRSKLAEPIIEEGDISGERRSNLAFCFIAEDSSVSTDTVESWYDPFVVAAAAALLNIITGRGKLTTTTTKSFFESKKKPTESLTDSVRVVGGLLLLVVWLPPCLLARA